MNRAFYTSNIKYLLIEEYNELINTIQKIDNSSKFSLRNLSAFLIAEYCGLRASEIGMIRFTDYNNHLSSPTIFCRRLKGSVSNTLKIVDPRVIETMNNFYEMRLQNPNHGQYLFASKSEKPLDRRTLDYLMKYYCSFTSIPAEKWHFHTLKHTRAMELIENVNGIDIRDVQWWLGHKYISNTMIYLNYSVQAQQKLYEKLLRNQFQKHDNE